MPVLKYDYTPLFRLDPVSKEYFAVFVPFVPIRLSMNHRISQSIINCLFDTGADISLFPATMCTSLGVNIKKGNLTEHIGIGSVSVLAYRHKVKIFVEGYSFNTFSDFSEQQNVPLLGRITFAEHFKRICLHGKGQDAYIELGY